MCTLRSNQEFEGESEKEDSENQRCIPHRVRFPEPPSGGRADDRPERKGEKRVKIKVPDGERRKKDLSHSGEEE